MNALDQAYDQAAGLRVQAREFAEGYDVRKVMAEHWVPALEVLEQRMKPKTLKPKVLAA